MSFIKLNYSEVLADSDRLAGLANLGEKCLKEMKNLSISIPSVWTGQASTAFINLCKQEEREINDLIGTLDTISRNLKLIANDLKAADDRAKMVIDNTISTSSNRNSSRTKL